jgi:hypothetical protein
MSISDFNPMILLFLCLVSLGALGMAIGALRRSSPGRYDVRNEEGRR